MNRDRKRRVADLTSPLPPVPETLAVLERLVYHRYETPARTRAALKLAHGTLVDLLRWIEAFAREESLISRSSAEFLHRQIRARMNLNNPKRFPPLPRIPSAAGAR
jgi:hypothetical protein